MILCAFIVLVWLGFDELNKYIYSEKQQASAVDYKNAEYVIENNRIRLKDGIASTEGESGSSSKKITKYVGNELLVDLNDDEREDVVSMLTQETGGSGIFYYVVAALNTTDGYVGSKGIFIGDRISPQSIAKGTGKIVIVNYADRAQGDPFTSAPTIGKSIWLLLDIQSMQFGEVVQDFEGEADPAIMSLGMKTWEWVSVTYPDGNNLQPKNADKFSLTFEKDGVFNATTDCNSAGGSYVINSSSITFSDIFRTLMYCDGSEETLFVSLLEQVDGYRFTSKGELIFDLELGKGFMTFR